MITDVTPDPDVSSSLIRIMGNTRAWIRPASARKPHSKINSYFMIFGMKPAIYYAAPKIVKNWTWREYVLVNYEEWKVWRYVRHAMADMCIEFPEWNFVRRVPVQHKESWQDWLKYNCNFGVCGPRVMFGIM